MARGLLISYPGYPYTPSSLLPDNGLANLAGALIEAGHEVLALDYGTVDTMRRLVPQSLRRKLSEVYDQVSRARNSGILALQVCIVNRQPVDEMLSCDVQIVTP